MLTVPNATTARALRPRDVAAGALLSVGFVVATAVVSGDGVLGPTADAPELLRPTPGSGSTPGPSPAAHDSTVNTAVITVLREPGQSMGSGVPSAGIRYADPLVPGGATAPEVPSVGVPGVRLSDVTGVGSGETTSPPSGTVDPGPLAAVTEPLLEPLAPVVEAAEPVIETLAEPVTDVAAQDEGAQPALTMLAPSLL